MIVDHLHSVVSIEVLAVIHQKENQSDEYKEQYQRGLKGVEYDERPRFEQNDQLKLHREARSCYCFMKLFLGKTWIIIIKQFLSRTCPTAIEYIESSQNQLNYQKVYCLIANRKEL